MRDYHVRMEGRYRLPAARPVQIGYASITYDFTVKPYRTMTDPFPWGSDGYNQEH